MIIRAIFRLYFDFFAEMVPSDWHADVSAGFDSNIELLVPGTSAKCTGLV